jgi:ABC-type transporter Mla subunit MlaD
MTDRIVSEHQQLADQLSRMEARIMARIDDLQSTLDTLTANVADYTSDVTGTLADVKAQLAAALARGTADQAQLEVMNSGVAAALSKIEALNDAVVNADVAVDRPSGPAA